MHAIALMSDVLNYGKEKMPVEIAEKDEKIWRYLVTHRTPTSREKIAKYFLISKSHASRALNYFVDAGIAEVIKIGRVKYYKVKE